MTKVAEQRFKNITGVKSGFYQWVDQAAGRGTHLRNITGMKSGFYQWVDQAAGEGMT